MRRKGYQHGVRLLEESCPVGFGPRIPDDDGLNACGVRGTQAGKRVLEDERLIGAHAEGLEREVVDLGVWLDAAHVLARENGVEDVAECKLGRDVRVDRLVDVDVGALGRGGDGEFEAALRERLHEGGRAGLRRTSDLRRAREMW